MDERKPLLDKISYTVSTPVISIGTVWGLPWHYHPHVEFIVVLDGAVTLEMENERRRLCAGDGALIFPYVPHCYYVEESGCERFMAVFDPQFYGEFRDIFLHSKPRSSFFTAAQTAELLPSDRRELSALCNNQSCRSLLEGAERYAKFAALLAKFLWLCGVSDVQKDQSLYRAAVTYCTQQLHDPSLTVEDVARALNVGRSKLNSLFSEQYGGVKAYINLSRLRHAEALLKNGNMSVAQVAAESGFAEVRTFNRLFKKKNGVSPSTYRKQ